MNWRRLEAAEPKMAEFGREQFEQSRVALIGTIRRDGSPRISCVEPCILDGDLYLGMMWQSRKALDLRRDPRILVRNAVCTNTGDERELSVRGRAVEIHNPEIRGRYVEAMAERTAWKEPYFHLFSVRIESAALVKYGGGEQSVRLWPESKEFRHVYG